MCNCKNELVQMPVSAHEADMEREDRKHKRNFIIILVLILALLGTNFGLIWWENQWEYVETTQTQTITQDSGEGGSNTYNGDFIGGDYSGTSDNN